MQRRRAFLLPVLAALVLGACALRGKAPAPAPPMPLAYAETAAADAAAPARDWWAAFGSLELSSLVAAALAANPDMASHRLRSIFTGELPDALVNLAQLACGVAPRPLGHLPFELLPHQK